MRIIKPLADYVLIEPIEKDKKLPSGIVLPDTTKEDPTEGKVIAKGPKAEVNVGGTVMFKKWGATKIKIEEGKEFLLVKEEDILAFINEE